MTVQENTSTPAAGAVVAAPAAAAATQATTTPAFAFPPTGDAGLDRAYSFVGAAGFGPDSEEMRAADKGDLTLLAASLAVKNPPGWREHLDLAQAALDRTAQTTEASAKATTAMVTKVMADAGVAWPDVQAFVRRQATQAERDELNEAFAIGGAAAKAAARHVLDAYLRDPNAKKTPKPASDGAGKGGSSKTGVLSAKEYQKGMADLRAKYPMKDINSLPEKQALDQQRMAGRRAGI